MDFKNNSMYRWPEKDKKYVFMDCIKRHKPDFKANKTKMLTGEPKIGKASVNFSYSSFPKFHHYKLILLGKFYFVLVSDLHAYPYFVYLSS